MSEEERAVLEAELEELYNEMEGVREQWIEGYISYDEAIETTAMYQEQAKEIAALLAQ